MLVTSAFDFNDGTNPARRYGKATGGLVDEFSESINGFETRQGLRAGVRLEERRGRGLAHESSTATITHAMGRSERSHAIEFANARI